MTSKNLFFKLQREDLKKRLWTIALSMITLFLGLPVFFAMLLSNYRNELEHTVGYITKDQINERILNYLGQGNVFVVFITVAGAIICGLSSFFYLHSRKKVDLYHSIPIRRELLFSVNFIDGILIYFIPYFINLLLSFVVIQVNGFMNQEILMRAFNNLGINILFYCLIYTVVVMAVMFTGNLVISCFGAAVFLLYGPLIMVLKEIYFSGFFKTYYMSDRFDQYMLFLSPIGVYVDSLMHARPGRIFTVLIVTVLLIGFVLFLYKKRASEAAGKAMAFGVSKPIIKFLLVIPLTLGGGILFRSITQRGNNGWFVFGLIFSFFLIYALIEIIYNFDIRSAFAYKKQMLSCAGIIVVIACIFQFDIFQYDSYIPKKDNVKSMSVSISGVDENYDYQYFRQNSNDYMNGNAYHLKYMKLTDIDSAYELAKIGLNENQNYDQNYSSDFEDKNFSYSVKYTLKSGRNVYRVYRMSVKDNMDLIQNIYDTKEYKEGHYPVYLLRAEDIKSLTCYNMINSKDISLDLSEKEQLLKIYKEELSNLTMQELTSIYPITTISMQIGERSMELNVFAAFSNTIAFLMEHGFDASYQISANDIKQIDVNYYNVKEEEKLNYESQLKGETSTYAPKNLTFSDKEQMEELFSHMIPSDYASRNYTLIDTDPDTGSSVLISKDNFGNEERYSFSFRRGEVPAFVKEAVE